MGTQLNLNYFNQFNLPEHLTIYKDIKMDQKSVEEVRNYDNKVYFFATRRINPENMMMISDQTEAEKRVNSCKSVLRLDIMKQIHWFLLNLPLHRKKDEEEENEN